MIVYCSEFSLTQSRESDWRLLFFLRIPSTQLVDCSYSPTRMGTRGSPNPTDAFGGLFILSLLGLEPQCSNPTIALVDGFSS